MEIAALGGGRNKVGHRDREKGGRDKVGHGVMVFDWVRDGCQVEDAEIVSGMYLLT